MKQVFGAIFTTFPLFNAADTAVSAEKAVRDYSLSPFDKTDTRPIERVVIGKKIVSDQALLRSESMGFSPRKIMSSFSFLPMLGTNLKMSGLIRNKVFL